jgi:PIN domain nuclease of toxin-antitoxin system
VSKFVLDASAVLALLFAELSGEKLTSDFLEDAAISTVNLGQI